MSLHLSPCLDMVLARTFYRLPGNRKFMTKFSWLGSGPSIGSTSVIKHYDMF